MPSTEEEETFTYDPEAAERGWQATAERRAKVAATDLPPLDLADAAIFGLKASRELMQADVRRLFEEIRSSRFDVSLLDVIEPASWGLWYANTRKISLEATSGGGRVRVETLAQGGDVKGRMMRVCDYMLADHHIEGRELASIRSGTGHKDLAFDLTRLAKLYETHRASFADGGGRHYDPADATAAKAIAAQILFEIGEGQAKELQDAKDDTSRAFIVLQDAYDHIRRWGGALWNDDDRFPSLFSVRPTRSRARPQNTTATDTGSTETT